MDRKALILYILFATTETAATQSTMTGSTSSPSRVSTAETTTTSLMSSFTTTACKVSANASLSVIEFRSLEKFIPDYSDSKSQAFQDRAKYVKDKIEAIYKLNYPSFIGALGLSFRAGSVITETELAFDATQDVPSTEVIAYALLNDTATLDALNITSNLIEVDGIEFMVNAEPTTAVSSAATLTGTTIPPSDTTLSTSATPSSTAFYSATVSAAETSSTPATSTPTDSSTVPTTLTGTSTTTAGETTTTPHTTVTTAESSTTPTATLTPTDSSTVPSILTSTTGAAIVITVPQSTASILTSVRSSSPAFESTTSKSTASTVSSASTTPTASTTSTAPTASTAKIPAVLTDLVFRSVDTFIEALSNQSTEEFKNRSKLVKDQLEGVYRPKYVNFLRVNVKEFSQGSIITKSQMFFSFDQPVPSVQEISNTPLTAVGTGDVSPLNIIAGSVSVNGSALTTTIAHIATTASSGLKIESSLLQATCLIIMSKILSIFI